MCYMLQLLIEMLYFQRYMCFFNSAEWAHLEQNVCLCQLKNLMGRQYSYQKLTQLYQGNHVLDAHASKLDDFLLRGMCVFST
jgi:hypothetical protein